MDLYFRNTGSDAWGTATNWSLSDGGPADGAVPTLTDDVFFTVNSGNCILTINRDCKDITFNGYVNTFNTNAFLRIYGNIDFVTTGFTLNGAAEWQVKAGGTSFTSNGKPLPSPLRYNHSSVGANTIVGDLILERSLFIQLTSNAPINGSGGTETIYVGGSLTTINPSRFLQGTINVVMNGTGTLSTATGGYIKTNLTINTTGTTTISTLYYSTGTFFYSAGTVNVINSMLCNASTTWNTNGINWNNVSFQGGTQTLTSDFTVNGSFASSNPVIYNGADLILSGSMQINQRIDGTSTLRYKGTGNWSQSGPINMNMVINTSGTLTLLGTVAAANLTHLSGNVITTGSTFINGGNLSVYNYSTSGITFDTVNFRIGTINLNQPFNASGVLTVGSSNTTSFDGNYGFNVGTFRCIVPGRLVTLKTGNTYNCDNLQLIGTNAARVFLRSSVTNVYTYLNLTTGGTCDVKYVNATDIDSSGGRLITDVKGTLLRTINWYKTNPDYFAFF